MRTGSSRGWTSARFPAGRSRRFGATLSELELAEVAARAPMIDLVSEEAKRFVED
jgi:hypothetical protein